MPDNRAESQTDWTQEWTSGDRRLEKYVLRRKLGAGASGVVWLALDTFLNREVALKISRDPVVADRDFRRRFQREAQIACRLKHPHIATVLDANEHQDHVYVAYELIDGETLSEHLKGRSLDPKDALRVTAQILSALQAAHVAKILHRDLSARNVMINHQGQGVVVDFGLAVASDQHTLSKENRAGTPGYMAPEIWEGKGPSEPSDLYSVGALLLQMLTGKSPKDVRNTTDSETFYGLSEAPSMVDVFVRRLAARRPEDRFQSADEAFQEILRIAKSGQVSGFVEKDIVSLKPAPLPRSLKETNWTTAVVGVALIVLALVLAPWDKLLEPSSADFSSVAILPLRLDPQDEEELRPLADGLSEAIVSRLSQIDGLRVTPWANAFSYRDAQENLQDVGSQLGVDAIITGTMREVGDRLQGSMALIRSDGGQSAAIPFDTERSQMLALQDEVTLGVVKALRRNLDKQKMQGLAQGPTQSEQAMEHYIKGSYLFRSGGQEANDLARIHLEKAVQIDPAFAEASVALGAVHSQRFWYGWGSPQDLRIASLHYKFAIQQDAFLVSAYRGLTHLYFEQGKNEDILRLGKMVRDLEHDGVEERLARAEAYFLGGLESKAVPVFESVIALDPHHQGAAWFVVGANAWSGFFEKAIERANAYEAAFGADTEILYWQGFAYAGIPNFEKAIECYERALGMTNDSGFDVATTYAFCANAYRQMNRQGVSMERARQGLAIIQEHIQGGAFNPRNHVAMGDLLYLLGDNEGGRREHERARAASGTRYTGHFFEAWALASLGQLEVAADMWNRSINTGQWGHVAISHFRVLSGVDVTTNPAFAVPYERHLAEQERLAKIY